MKSVNVLVVVPFAARHVARLRGVDPTLEIHVAPAALRGFLANELPASIGRWFVEDDWPDADDSASLEEQIATLLRPAEVIIALPRFPAGTLDQVPNLRWVQFLSAGVERFDAAAHPHLLVTNGSGAAGIGIAEHVLGLMLQFARGFPALRERQQAKQWDRGWVARELNGATCGIVGMGAIGTEVARRAKAMNMRVIAVRRSGATGRDQLADEVLPPSGLPYLLRESDYVVLAAPLTPETRDLIGAAELALMKRSAVLINVGRGAILDEDALCQALRDGTIGGAGLDVVRQEPLSPESPLWAMQNVVITPHSSVRTERHFDRVTDMLCENLRRYVAGQPLRNLVDPGRGY